MSLSHEEVRGSNLNLRLRVGGLPFSAQDHPPESSTSKRSEELLKGTRLSRSSWPSQD